ncbi:MAG: triacylglycerol lipase [Deinococcus sp.]|uniref:esterase/lipase family protein n=1 Tax=Deinococcus sp. TaxID=47478 RepID=UPI0026DD1363|nr:triacylglycerol lipase [Deinococcus sp.]MDO4246030.1 triacylglycerol lipase [Deinococcus sp.]
MKKSALLIPVLSLLLAACGQSTPAVTPSASATAGGTAAAAAEADYAARKAAALQAQANPTEPLVKPEMTDLATTYPGGKPISAQAVDKSVPIVLVHGLGGFGRNEALGIKYWGGLVDVQEDLKSLGYKVFTVSMGPLSSNWDRAAEAYAQIKGGCVDYGAVHSQEAGHTRHDTRKCYPGFYPQWDAEHPVNLIGHSMGAPTARLLVKLLDDGSPENADGDNLFVGGRHGWVKNLMTISGANSGSPASDSLQDEIPFFKDLLITMAGGLSALSVTNAIYDFDLGQFGLYRQPGESFKSYSDRVFDPNNALWTTNDQGGYDLRVDGAYEANQFIGRSAYTKYFSWATEDTSRGLITGWRYPNVTMWQPLVATAYPYPWPMPNGLGNQSGSSPLNLVSYDASWWENDGLVPVKAQHEPLGEQASDYTGQPTQPGQWYRLGQLDGYDHLDITGNLTIRDVKQFYRNQAAFLSSQN